MLGTRCSAIIIHQVTMRAACIISWNELMQTSFSVSKSFILILKLHSQVRPVVETGWENTLIIRTSFQGLLCGCLHCKNFAGSWLRQTWWRLHNVFRSARCSGVAYGCCGFSEREACFNTCAASAMNQGPARRSANAGFSVSKPTASNCMFFSL